MYRSSTAQGISVKLWVLPGLVLVTTPATELITVGAMWPELCQQQWEPTAQAGHCCSRIVM